MVVFRVSSGSSGVRSDRITSKAPRKSFWAVEQPKNEIQFETILRDVSLSAREINIVGFSVETAARNVVLPWLHE